MAQVDWSELRKQAVDLSPGATTAGVPPRKVDRDWEKWERDWTALVLLALWVLLTLTLMIQGA
jgi:hypothetical protein